MQQYIHPTDRGEVGAVPGSWIAVEKGDHEVSNEVRNKEVG